MMDQFEPKNPRYTYLGEYQYEMIISIQQLFTSL